MAVRRVLDWLDHRTGYRRGVGLLLDEPVPGGASFAYVFGSVLTFLLGLQAVTGVFLALYYSPSATDAWASVAHIQDTVTLGWFVRGLHAHGASAMVIVAGLHLLQTALYGAYKKPREMNWIVGVLMLGLLLAFALTGYLLPWDQTGYWATKVATGIAGTTPLVGAQLQQAAQGGNEYGNLTLTRFFALHALVLPALLFGLAGLHLFLFRKHGVTPRWGKSDEELARATRPFWPDQLFRDMVAVAVVFAALVAIDIASHGARLDAPADPSSSFDARPEWYFRALFQLLKYFEGPLERVVALGVPALAAAVLLGLPFADRGPNRDPRARAGFLAVLAAGLVGVGALTLVSFRDDAGDPALQKRLAAAEVQARTARKLAAEHGVPVAGGTAVFTTAPYYEARKLFAQHCAPCHASGERKGPALGPGYNSRAWLRAFMAEPHGDAFFGPTKIDKMKPVKLTGVDLDAVIELVYSQSGAPDADPALVARGQSLFDEGPCSDCHSIDWETEGETGPNLGRRGSVDMLAEFLVDPGHPRWFGEKNEMPRFNEKLDARQRRLMAEYLASLRDATAPPEE